MEVKKFLKQKQKFLKQNTTIDLRNHDFISGETLNDLNWKSMESQQSGIVECLCTNQALTSNFF